MNFEDSSRMRHWIHLTLSHSYYSLYQFRILPSEVFVDQTAALYRSYLCVSSKSLSRIRTTQR